MTFGGHASTKQFGGVVATPHHAHATSQQQLLFGETAKVQQASL